jgi:hypothetical protein
MLFLDNADWSGKRSDWSGNQHSSLTEPRKKLKNIKID